MIPAVNDPAFKHRERHGEETLQDDEVFHDELDSSG
jgi:hypothetical protein